MSSREWREFEIGDFTKWKSGGTPSKSNPDFWNGDIPWISAKTFKDTKIITSEIKITKSGLENGSRLANKGEILLLVRGSGLFNDIPIGLVESPVAFNQDIKSIEVDEEIMSSEYFHFWLRANKYILEGMLEHTSIGAGKFNIDRLKALKGSFPSKCEQKAIAATLSCLDDKIELNNRMNKNLEERAQAIFKSWFVNFEPFQEGEFEESELGMIPKGWRVSCLDKVADYLNGLAMQKYRPDSDDFLPVIKIKELNQEVIDQSSDKAAIDIPEQYVIENGDVIFSWSGTLLVKIWTGGKGALNQHLFKVTSTQFEKWFYYYWTLYHLDNFKAIAKDKATTMGHIKRSHLSEAIVLIPDESSLYKMDELMNPLIKQIIELKIQNRKLQEIRDTLLPKLMSGEVRVPYEEVI